MISNRGETVTVRDSYSHSNSREWLLQSHVELGHIVRAPWFVLWLLFLLFHFVGLAFHVPDHNSCYQTCSSFCRLFGFVVLRHLQALLVCNWLCLAQKDFVSKRHFDFKVVTTFSVRPHYIASKGGCANPGAMWIVPCCLHQWSLHFIQCKCQVCCPQTNEGGQSLDTANTGYV